jgi:hypothetical protein
LSPFAKVRVHSSPLLPITAAPVLIQLLARDIKEVSALSKKTVGLGKKC